MLAFLECIRVFEGCTYPQIKTSNQKVYVWNELGMALISKHIGSVKFLYYKKRLENRLTHD